MSLNLKELLEKEFDDHGWKVRSKQLLKPTFSTSAESRFKFVIESIEWTDGPDSHQVFYWLFNNHSDYLESKEYYTSSVLLGFDPL